jgi:DNA mismatch repair protein MutL
MPAVSCSTKIHVLPDDVVSRIAAGEVVERPAAVVKELLENSLDAGGLHITIDVKDGGLALIRVTDDGEGINRADLLLAFERHATSKLRSDRDLASVTTMGFRGEALPSIASVSHVLVTTSTRQETMMGSQLTLVAGASGSIVNAPAVPGTRIDVSNLFFNQPARKKFLKSATTEFSHISHTVQLAGLAWPSVHFRLTHNGQEILNYPAVTADRDRILQVYRQAFLDRTIEVQGRTAGLSIRGVMIDPVHARSSRTPQELFVNRRPIRNATVFHAVMDGYGSFLPKGHHPTFVLFLDIEPDRLDVNVHPTKKEVRFAETEALHQLVRQSVRHALGGSERKVVSGLSQAGLSQTVSDAPTVERQPTASGDFHPTALISARKPDSRVNVGDTLSLSGTVEGSQLAFAHEAAAMYQRAEKPDIVPFGQILRTYLVAQVGEELQVVDQHTAHERVLFQRLWRGWQSREIPSQPLLIPEPIDLSAAQSALLLKRCDDLEKLGLLIEPFGATAVAIRGVPVGLGKVDVTGLVQDLLEDLTEWDSVSSLEMRVQPVLASLACHGAVRAGRALALPEIQQLIHDWVQEGLIMTCPHGRRTAFRLSTDELAKLFGRVGWS